MKLASLLLAIGLPLSAQNFELGVNVSKQSYTNRTSPGFAGHPDPVLFDFESKTVIAGRIGYSLLNVGPAVFQLSAAYQPKVNTELKPNGVTVPTKLGSEYWGVGAMFQFQAVANFGAGIDYRFEKSTMVNIFTSSHSFNRPWARVNAGYSLPAPVVKPFISIEVAAPLSKEDNSPKLQVGINAGIRF